MNLAVDPSVAPFVDPVLDQIRSRVAPTVLAHEQTLPVADGMAELFAERALVRGRTLTCTGPAGTSAAMALVAAAVAAGSWLAVVDVPTFGLDAASEAGIALERVVAIDTASNGGGGAGWVEVMAAAVDGFDLVVSRQPSPVSEAALRKLATRIRQRGAVVVLLDGASAAGSSGAGLRCDGVVETSVVSWSGIGSGYGHLQQRTLDLSTSGRRLPGRRQCRLGLVAGLVDGRVRGGVRDGVHDDVA
ncbi:MAG: hypothetical protein ABWZ99_16555 [Ilumatobacteraceae bacterium]